MPKQPLPEPTWKLYEKFYRRGFLIGQHAKAAGLDRDSFLELRMDYLRAEDIEVPLCMWCDYKEGCLDGYDGNDRRGSISNR